MILSAVAVTPAQRAFVIVFVVIRCAVEQAIEVSAHGAEFRGAARDKKLQIAVILHVLLHVAHLSFDGSQPCREIAPEHAGQKQVQRNRYAELWRQRERQDLDPHRNERHTLWGLFWKMDCGEVATGLRGGASGV